MIKYPLYEGSDVDWLFCIQRLKDEAIPGIPIYLQVLRVIIEAHLLRTVYFLVRAVILVSRRAM